jgi:alpha/beta superfamily hydrolase
MNAATQKLVLQGGAGAIEALLDVPAQGQPLGTAVIAHPHPLFGGTMTNKVVQTLARAFVQAGWRAVRFNFRGVGASAGAYDEGRGPPGAGRLFLRCFCDQPCGAATGRAHP